MSDRPTPETDAACEDIGMGCQRDEAREQERIHYDNFVALQREGRGEI